MKASFLLSLFTGLALFSCHSSDRGSDNRYTEDRDLDGVSRLRISGVFNLNISQSDQERLSIDGSPELAENLNITQEGDLLILELKELNSGIFHDNSLQVNLAISDLKELEFDGVGNIQTTETFNVDQVRIKGEGVGNLELDFETQKLDANLNLLGKMDLRGKADKVSIRNEGIGKIDASQFVAQDMDLVSSGIGKIEVHCEGDLSLKVDGIGKVTYTGNPTVIKKEVSGIGRVEAN